nr:tigger transposable element-derived protein 7-like [Procambarus clarkii]
MAEAEKTIATLRAVYKWFAQHRTAGVTIRGPEIQNATSRFAASLGIRDFEASEGWVARFKVRHNIVKRKIDGEKLSANESSEEPFKQKLRAYILSNNLYSYKIYNADETGLYWRSLPEKTLAMRSEGCVPGRKVNKDRLSAMMCANGNGTERITCATVGKSKKPRALQHCLDRLPMKYYNSQNAKFTQEIFLSWFHDMFMTAGKFVPIKLRNSKYGQAKFRLCCCLIMRLPTPKLTR